MSQGPDQPNAIGSTTPPMGTGAAPPSPVQSVFGRVGNVVGQLGDYAASLITNDSTVAGATVEDALDTLGGLITPATREIFVIPQGTADQNDYRTRNVGGAGAWNFNFWVPHDFTTLVDVVAIADPNANIVAGDADLFSSYGEEGASVTQFTESDIVSTFNLTADVWNALDLSTVFNSLAAGMYCGVEINHNGVGVTVRYLGIRMRYT